MKGKNASVDDYIASAVPFARPILAHVRDLVHTACPGVQETIRWRFPHFDHHGIMLGMAAFKNHCAVGFWKAELIFDKGETAGAGMGNFGRITSLMDLPPQEEFIEFVRRAAQLNETGVKRTRPAARERKALIVPTDFKRALNKNRKAAGNFERLSYSHRKEYLEWIGEAKREETRLRRIKHAVSALADGKSRS